jgi:hypothetical protein
MTAMGALSFKRITAHPTEVLPKSRPNRYSMVLSLCVLLAREMFGGLPLFIDGVLLGDIFL